MATPQTNSYSLASNPSSHSSQSRQKLSPRTTLQAYTPPLTHDDDIFSHHGFSDRESLSSGTLTPPLFGYSQYPSQEDSTLTLYPSYAQPMPHSAYRTPDYEYHVPQPMALPPMSHLDLMGRPLGKRPEDAGNGLDINPFSLSYASMAGLDMQQQGYENTSVGYPYQ